VLAHVPAIGRRVVADARVAAEQRLEEAPADLAVLVMAGDEGEVEQLGRRGALGMRQQMIVDLLPQSDGQRTAL
jgi:hypothetical protein